MKRRACLEEDYSRNLIGINREMLQGRWFGLGCGQRRCRKCARRRRKLFIERVRYLMSFSRFLTRPGWMATRRREMSLITLTWKYDKSLTGEARRAALEDAWCQAAETWRACYKRLHKRWGPFKNLPFAWVVEAHKSGYPHIHLILGLPFAPIQLIDKYWKQAGGGHAQVSRGKPQDGKDAVDYAAKYITKLATIPDEVWDIIERNRIRTAQTSVIPRGESLDASGAEEKTRAFVEYWYDERLPKRLAWRWFGVRADDTEEWLDDFMRAGYTMVRQSAEPPEDGQPPPMGVSWPHQVPDFLVETKDKYLPAVVIELED